MCIGQVNATNEIGDKIVIDTTSWTDVLVMAISFINLIFIVAFYINDQKNRESDQKINYKFFWYKDYVLKDAINIIEEHIDNCKNILEECKRYKLSGPNVEEYSRYLQETTIWNFNKSNNNTKQDYPNCCKQWEEIYQKILLKNLGIFKIYLLKEFKM